MVYKISLWLNYDIIDGIYYCCCIVKIFMEDDFKFQFICRVIMRNIQIGYIQIINDFFFSIMNYDIIVVMLDC